MKVGLVGWCLLAILLFTPVGEWMESAMVLHMLLLYPALTLAGALIVWPARRADPKWLRALNQGGVVGVLITSFVLAFWMVPRWIDLSLASETVGVYKYL